MVPAFMRVVRAGHASRVALLALCVAGCSDPEPAKPEHVVLIVIDTLRADHLSTFGYPRETSPNLDAFAASGVTFENAVSQCSYTAPSMVSLMTGRYIAKERLDVPADLATLAESFDRAGFKTAAFVSNAAISKDNGFGRGFELFEHLPEYGSNAQIEAWFDRVGGQKSFTYIHIIEPHDHPIEAQGGKTSYGRRDQPPGPWRTSADLVPGDREEFWKRTHGELGLSRFEESVAEMREQIGAYDDDVRYTDGRIGEFLRILDQRDLRAKSAIAITSDHGEGLWQRVAFLNGQRQRRLIEGEPPTLENTLMPTHGNQVTRELVHVPMFLSAPGLPEGRRVARLVENIDLFPTLLELCDLSAPKGLHGESLIKPLRDERAPKKQFAFSYTRFNATVITADGLQFIMPTAEGECAEGLVPELYDLRADPHQRTNIAASKPDVVRELTQLIEERMATAIKEPGRVTNADMAAMALLGYGDQLRREEQRLEFERADLAFLLKRLNPGTPCPERLLLVEALAKRELDDAARAQLELARTRETSRAVNGVLDAILAR